MNNSSITPISSNWQILIWEYDQFDRLYRLRQYVDWLNTTGQTWHNPNLTAYRDFLMSDQRTRHVRDKDTGQVTGVVSVKPLAASSCQIYLSTVRARYKELLKSNVVRDNLYKLTPAEASAADKKAFVDELLQRLQNAIDPDTAQVTVEKVQDVADTKHLRLTRAQASALLHAPFMQDENKPLLALRNAAMLALMLCTGCREQELCNLEVNDLRQTFGGALALHIRKGKGCKTRLIPYGNLDWCLGIVDAWLHSAGIEDGPVFRGLYKCGKRKREGKIHVRAVNQVLDRYEVSINGTFRKVNPHDLRRTYARRLYEAGVNILAIQQNLGHSDHKTTEKYIGVMSADDRQPPSLYDFDSSYLKRYRLIAFGTGLPARVGVMSRSRF